MNEKGAIKMVISNGLFLVGRMSGGSKMDKPRLFQVIDDGKRIQMGPLPGTPPFCMVGENVISYPVPEREHDIINLYERVTSPEAEAALIAPKHQGLGGELGPAPIRPAFRSPKSHENPRPSLRADSPPVEEGDEESPDSDINSVQTGPERVQ